MKIISSLFALGLLLLSSCGASNNVTSVSNNVSQQEEDPFIIGTTITKKYDEIMAEDEYSKVVSYVKFSLETTITYKAIESEEEYLKNGEMFAGKYVYEATHKLKLIENCYAKEGEAPTIDLSFISEQSPMIGHNFGYTDSEFDYYGEINITNTFSLHYILKDFYCYSAQIRDW